MSKNNCRCAGNSCCVAEASRPAAPVASTTLTAKDKLGAWKVRWGIGRDNYKVEPGLYAVGKPGKDSHVLVSANYKLTFDALRKNLSGLDCWLLILDTKGVNVWCAAGKGTFGTEELIDRIGKTGLSRVVTHRRLILPQLGAPGVDSGEVARHSGFSVTFGPVRAADILRFIADGCKATREMRTVKFTFGDRLALVPMELVGAAKIPVAVFAVMFLLNLFAVRPFGLADFFAFSASLLAGAVVTPALLPFIPGRAFAFKGWIAGAVGTAFIAHAHGWFAPPYILLGIGYMLALPAFSAFLSMNFTGASTYTSFSGVIKEMKVAVPATALSTAAGVVLVLIKTFTG